MHVILNTAGNLRDGYQSADGTAEVLMETTTPIRFYQRSAVLGADDDVIMYTVSCLQHYFMFPYS